VECLEKFQKFFNGQSRLFDDRLKGSSFQIFIVVGDRNPKVWFARMLQDVVTSARMVHKETGPLECAKDIAGLERGQSLAHAASSATFIFSLTG